MNSAKVKSLEATLYSMSYFKKHYDRNEDLERRKKKYKGNRKLRTTRREK